MLNLNSNLATRLTINTLEAGEEVERKVISSIGLLRFVCLMLKVQQRLSSRKKAGITCVWAGAKLRWLTRGSSHIRRSFSISLSLYSLMRTRIRREKRARRAVVGGLVRPPRLPQSHRRTTWPREDQLNYCLLTKSVFRVRTSVRSVGGRIQSPSRFTNATLRTPVRPTHIRCVDSRHWRGNVHRGKTVTTQELAR